MRKFRGKAIDHGKHHGKMVYGHLSEWESGSWIDCGTEQESEWVPVDPETVGQFIGIKDGTTDEEWCEDDILTPNPHAKNQELQVICYDIHQGRYKGVPLSAYELNAGNGGWTGFDIKSWQKRIGNVHENPELLAPKEGAEQHETD
ncbi:hypothetical protein C161_27578 [Paenibacillus sp. FSL R5-192]|uniref:YopX family protein n=1 Tax=Paenibacillus sp. FSL R5-192 TaxID=1226754 RepID=UPI0003E2B864|nr:YopX family protein [Paenibacillus sp. FSL R5-192]ETT30289.1 hypothetical protein C161_27578 [Paenibacillus sp. FSL R5-192]